MFGFGIMIARLFSAVRGAWHEPAFRGTALSLLLVWIGATAFYAGQEDWGVLDSFYFAVCTGLTIGYGDLAPITDAGKVFTVVYALLAVGLFAALVAQLASAFINTQSARVRRYRAGRDRHRGGAGPEEPEG
ncbi:potassium channel family protein [Streptomyces sp. BPTC-684]|uniref:potassium channel family protein n=1 Tax=Streptomyces sp. BPTC-684 TaxID=3043734 RepID=UPI0024B14BB4|nr:potassium channel family protein [Streptomyces sp. BPTC-684]WHM40944.1 potassium channel family protein [Streptomyces sp. BPTC-684]